MLVLEDPHMLPTEISTYDLIIVSYAFVRTQYKKWTNFQTKLELTTDETFLQEPSLSIFSKMFLPQQDTFKFAYLVLDEVTTIKNTKSQTFKAVKELGERAKACIMLSGSPLQNTWHDVLAYMKFDKNQPLENDSAMKHIFAPGNQRQKIPIDVRLKMLVQALNALVIRRPQLTIALPPLISEEIIFDLDPSDLGNSNYEFEIFKRSAASELAARATPVENEGKAKLFGPFKRAQWWACHRELLNQAVFGAQEETVPRRQVDWEAKLSKANIWRSRRIDQLLRVYDRCRDVDPECKVLIFDESVLFLDIVEVAFNNMDQPQQCLRFDGRIPSDKRPDILSAFEKAAGTTPLLISSTVGGHGLKITTANVVILCTPWWQQELELQAIKRAYHPGQIRPVTVIRLRANCKVESHIALTRDTKNQVNSNITDQITRPDGSTPETWQFDEGSIRVEPPGTT